MRRTRAVAATALTSLLASVIGIGPAVAEAAGGHVPVWDKGPGGERYVAFGDSFTSGPGIEPQRAGSCLRSERSFPSLVAAGLGVQAFTDASCGGAVLADLGRAQRSNPPQLDALSADTSLVTFGTLGGNDVGLVQLAASCLGTDCTGTPGDANHQRVESTRPVLAEGIRETRRRAPGAIIAVVGYGTYLPRGGCPDVLPITPAEADYVQGVIDHLSDVLEEVAAAEGAAFVDLRDIPGAAEHTACAAPDQQWIRAMETYGDGAPLHPSSAGMAAMAGQVRAVVEQVWADDPLHPIPAPAPVGPTRADAEAALERVRFSATCRNAGGHRVVRLQVRRGQGMVSAVRFRVGDKVLRTDRREPFRAQRRVAALPRLDGRLRARVTVTAGEAEASRMLFVRRPRCVR